MISRHKTLALSDAAPGMTLADTICDSYGDILLPAGAQLTEITLISLQRRGIDNVVVAVDMSAAELAAERERQRLRLDRLFRKCGTVGCGALLYDAITAYRLGDLG